MTAAANKLIEMGIADSARLGVHGTSYGGYATNLLITQTNRFKAAINISGKVDLISFYTDSPRLGVRNITRGGEEPGSHRRHAVAAAAEVRRALGDHVRRPNHDAADADHRRSRTRTFRRTTRARCTTRCAASGKKWCGSNYMNGGHGGGTATADDFLDMQRRMLECYDSKLKKAMAKTATNDR